MRRIRLVAATLEKESDGERNYLAHLHTHCLSPAILFVEELDDKKRTSSFRPNGLHPKQRSTFILNRIGRCRGVKRSKIKIDNKKIKIYSPYSFNSITIFGLVSHRLKFLLFNLLHIRWVVGGSFVKTIGEIQKITGGNSYGQDFNVGFLTSKNLRVVKEVHDPFGKNVSWSKDVCVFIDVVTD